MYESTITRMEGMKFILLTILIHIVKLFPQSGTISSLISTYFISFQYVLLLSLFKIFANLIDENCMYGQFWLSFLLLLVRLAVFHIFMVFSIISIPFSIDYYLDFFYHNVLVSFLFLPLVNLKITQISMTFHRQNKKSWSLGDSVYKHHLFLSIDKANFIN